MMIDLSHPTKTPINISVVKIQTPKFMFDNKRLIYNTQRQTYKNPPYDLKNIAPG